MYEDSSDIPLSWRQNTCQSGDNTEELLTAGKEFLSLAILWFATLQQTILDYKPWDVAH